MTALEDLRTTMNRDRKSDQPKLTILPYLMRALVRTIADQPAGEEHVPLDLGDQLAFRARGERAAIAALKV